MPDDLSAMGGTRRELGALLFLAAGTNALDVYSALNSSPWTAENFGANAEKAKSCREYVTHSIAVTSFYGVVAAVVSGMWWPIIGTVLANVYMYWLYDRALKRGQASQSNGWEKA